MHEQELVNRLILVSVHNVCFELKYLVLHYNDVGKTTSLEAVVLKIKLDQVTKPLICYTAFNKTTETEFGERIRKKLLANNLPNRDIESRTLHSLCYNWFTASRGGEYLRDLKDSIEPEAVVNFFQLEKLVAERYGTTVMAVNVAGGGGRSNRSKQQRIKFEAMWVAELILKTLETFLNSAAPDVTDKHLPYQIVSRYKEWTDKLDAYLIKHHILQTTAAAFYQRFDFKGRASALYKQSLMHNQDAGLSVTHSVYQKFVQLSNAVLTSKQGKIFDVFLIDEAQDLNECQCAIITRQWQQGSTITLVGDPAQSIYQFRGACRQFERWEVDNEETLTMSFRFGREVARVCNIMLGLEKLWLLSLRNTINPTGLPGNNGGVKPEGGGGGGNNGNGDGGAAAAVAVAGGVEGAASQMIQALVRGLPAAEDRWVKPSFALDYPYTVICRTNNNTYYALLAGIQEAIRQYQAATEAANSGVDPAGGSEAAATQGGGGDIFTGDVQRGRKRPCVDSCDSVKRTVAYDLTSQATTQSSGSNGFSNVNGATVLSGPSGFSSNGQQLFSQQQQGAFTQHTQHTQHSNTQQQQGAGNRYVTPVLDRHSSSSSAAGGPYQSQPSQHRQQQESSRPTTGSQYAPGGIAAGAASSQIVPNGMATGVTTGVVAAPRKFFINGVRSYGQLENGLVRRIEQLAGIGQQKPYMYKGEQYIELEGLKDAANEMEDVALLELIEITEKWGSDIGNIKHLIRNHYAENAAEADVLVTTVHKSKGLEWDHVTLGEDIGHPLQAQQLFVIECSREGGKFMVGLEATPTSAFDQVNNWLLVGKPLTADPQTDAAAATTSTTVAVKAEPGLPKGALGHKSQSQPAAVKPSSSSSSSSEIIDLMDDDDDWVCGRCARSNGDYASSCAKCKLSRRESDDLALRKKKVQATFHDHSGINVESSAEEDNEYGGCPCDVPAPPPSCFNPSHDNKLVSLLPSTIALGYHLQRGVPVAYPAEGVAPAGVAPSSENDSGGCGGGGNIFNNGAPRVSKCPLICPYPSHQSCTSRTQKMYQHELAERRRLHGTANVCAMECAGSANGPGNKPRLLFARDEVEVAAIRAAAPAGAAGAGGAAMKADPGAQPAVVDLSSLPRLDPFLIKFSSRQNANEWYVAVSRAKKVLRVNTELATTLEWIERDIGGLRTQLRALIGNEVEVTAPVVQNGVQN